MGRKKRLADTGMDNWVEQEQMAGVSIRSGSIIAHHCPPKQMPKNDNPMARLRCKNNWSQAETADILGVTSSLVSLIERDKSPLEGELRRLVLTHLGEHE